MRNTRPLELKFPRMIEGSVPMTRLSTVLAAVCWMNVVISLGAMENAPQLMMAPGVLVMMRLLPLDLNVALPDTTVGLPGLAWTSDVKHEATARTMALAFHVLLCNFCRVASTAPRASPTQCMARAKKPRGHITLAAHYSTKSRCFPTGRRLRATVREIYHEWGYSGIVTITCIA